MIREDSILYLTQQVKARTMLKRNLFFMVLAGFFLTGITACQEKNPVFVEDITGDTGINQPNLPGPGDTTDTTGGGQQGFKGDMRIKVYRLQEVSGNQNDVTDHPVNIAKSEDLLKSGNYATVKNTDDQGKVILTDLDLNSKWWIASKKVETNPQDQTLYDTACIKIETNNQNPSVPYNEGKLVLRKENDQYTDNDLCQ